MRVYKVQCRRRGQDFSVGVAWVLLVCVLSFFVRASGFISSHVPRIPCERQGQREEFASLCLGALALGLKKPPTIRTQPPTRTSHLHSCLGREKFRVCSEFPWYPMPFLSSSSISLVFLTCAHHCGLPPGVSNFLSGDGSFSPVQSFPERLHQCRQHHIFF